GRDRGRHAGRCGARRYHLFQSVLGRSVHVSPDGGGAAHPPARPLRRTHREIRMMHIRRDHLSLAIAALMLALLPSILDATGLPLRTAIDVVAYAVACMGLNILVGYTGLVSFGHGAWFGLGAYAAALSQRYWFSGDVILPALFALAFAGVAALGSGALILRRRGVYFSLLTLALTALLFAIAYRWTEVTGGESGLGGVTRSTVLGLD